jgi:hypothetical protein
VRLTSASPLGLLVLLPLKTSASKFSLLSADIFCSPITQRILSMILLLPHPFGPMIPVIPSSKLTTVLSAKLLNPLISNDFNLTTFKPAPEPSTLLAEAKQIAGWIKKADPDRLNQDSVLYRMQELLRSSHIYILKNADEALQREFVAVIIKIIEPLNTSYYSKVLGLLEPIGLYPESFYAVLIKKKKQRSMAKASTIFLAIIMAVLLCLMIIFISRK